MAEDCSTVRRHALQVMKEFISPFSKWEFFKAYNARYGSKLPYADLGFANLCDFIESLPDVQLVGSPGLYAYTGENIAVEPPPSPVVEESRRSTTISSGGGRARTLSLSFLKEEESAPVLRAQCDSSGISDDGRVWQTLEEKPAFSNFTPHEAPMLPQLPASFVTHKEFKDRALEITSKHPRLVDVSRFSQEYMYVYGVPRVPYAQLGYARLIDCLRAIPELTHRLPPPGSSPTKLFEIFRERSLQIVATIRCPFKIEVFSRTYRITYSVRAIPFRDFGFSTLFECLLSIPEVAKNLDIALELEVLEIVKEWRSAFHPLKIISPYRTRNNTDRMPPWREYFYDSASELMSSLPGVVRLGCDLFAFKGDPQLIPAIHDAIRSAKGQGIAPPVPLLSLDLQMPDNVSTRDDVHEEKPSKEERPKEERPDEEKRKTSEEKETIKASTSRASFSKELEPTFLPQKADDLLSASTTEDESRSDFTNPNSVGPQNHFHHHPSASPHCCQSSIVHPPATFSRNEHYGRLLTSLLDDAERRGENADELAVRALNTVMGFRLEEEEKKKK